MLSMDHSIPEFLDITERLYGQKCSNQSIINGYFFPLLAHGFLWILLVVVYLLAFPSQNLKLMFALDFLKEILCDQNYMHWLMLALPCSLVIGCGAM